jgi:hypothetical protein
MVVRSDPDLQPVTMDEPRPRPDPDRDPLIVAWRNRLARAVWRADYEEVE